MLKILTGATGALGCEILGILTDDPSVITIICPVRASGEEEATRRVRKTLMSRGRKASDLENMSEKVTCIPANNLAKSQHFKSIQNQTAITIIHVRLLGIDVRRKLLTYYRQHGPSTSPSRSQVSNLNLKPSSHYSTSQHPFPTQPTSYSAPPQQASPTTNHLLLISPPLPSPSQKLSRTTPPTQAH
jgi:hypothetical protein